MAGLAAEGEGPIKIIQRHGSDSSIFDQICLDSLKTAPEPFFGKGAAGSKTPAATTGRADYGNNTLIFEIFKT